jgi:HK97 family phage portal protein
MSLLSRFVDTVSAKVNTERLPTGLAPSFTGSMQSAGATNQMGQLAAMTSVGWLFAVVNRIAQSIASQDWNLYRTIRGERVLIDSHPALDLWRSANPFVTREDFLETSQQHMELCGEMWWVLVRNGAGIPVEMQVVRPDRMAPIPHPTEFISGYEYKLGTTRMRLETEDVIYTRNPSPLDAYRGIGVVQSMMVDLGAERAAAEWMQSFFRNSAEPGGIIEFPNSLTDVDFQRLADRWRFQHQGVANAHRVAILERGTWKDRKLTQRDMQFEQLRRFERDQILGAFGMPLPIMGLTESVNRANAEAAEVMYARWLIRPRLTRIRAALNEKLLKLYPDGETLEFDFVDPVPENRAELITAGQVGYQNQILTLNEARAMFGAPPKEDPEADVVPISNMAGNLQVRSQMEIERQSITGYTSGLLTLNEARLRFEEGPRPDGDELLALAEPLSLFGASAPEGWEPSFVDEFGFEGYGPDQPQRLRKLDDNPEYPDEANRSGNRMERGWTRRFGIEMRALIAYIEQADKAADPVTKLVPGIADGYDWDWFAKYGDEVAFELSEAFALVLAASSTVMSIPEVQLLASRFAEERTQMILGPDGKLSLTRQARSRVNELVSSTIEAGETLNTLARDIRKDEGFSRSRARRIARTETATVLGQGQRQAAVSEGYTEKHWVSAGGGEAAGVSFWCEANDNAGWIPINDTFPSGDPTIPQHPNCRCTVLYRAEPLVPDEEYIGGRGFVPEVRCPQCNRKHGENVAVGTQLRCRRCKHEWEVE